MRADVQNVLSKREMFEKISGGETSKQGQEVESVLCQANNVGQFGQAFRPHEATPQVDSISSSIQHHPLKPTRSGTLLCLTQIIAKWCKSFIL